MKTNRCLDGKVSKVYLQTEEVSFRVSTLQAIPINFERLGCKEIFHPSNTPNLIIKRTVCRQYDLWYYIRRR